jgi:hypothetical protein
MEIPRYWAEHREQRILAGRRHVTLRRFGWSADSQEAAQQHAVQRVAEAWANWDAGRKPTRREAKVAYAGADGLPIREEIISEHPEAGAIVTRNAYGARCLNVADVLFADVDLGEARSRLSDLRWTTVGFLILLGILACFVLGKDGAVRVLPAVLLAGAGLLALWRIPVAWRRWRWAAHPELVLPPVHRWCESHPAWRVRVYRTPAGLRLLANHAAIDPRGDEATAFFSVVDADPMYRLMCQKQACFRARVSPKPWRIGIAARIGWGTWPVAKDGAIQRRSAWVEAYEKASTGYAACAFLEDIGDGSESPRGRAVRELHDRMCQIGRSLPLA